MEITIQETNKQLIESAKQLLTIEQMNEPVTDGSSEYVEQLF
ncbi:hypothetical protein ABEV54_12685 [Peribacillus psychrosaccharolyticus]